ncbi:MiaB/RimO family radical SAM methylthiotransferase [Enorma sp.]|uniref:MiaB/RimO family radical SAM methylthiotransferase n=1 Tax=Enorma sp. TaxID=1920692 RepID=UPI0025C2ABE1|nr:MiaB/RimO family radical SAM methylthiotransferase [Enorma sp.]
MANPFVSVINLGCRVNRVESDRMERELASAGLLLVDPEEAELIVINTCAVTGEAEAKTRKAVRHALGQAREPLVIATGCAAALHPESLRELSDRVIVVPSKVDVAARSLDALGYSASAPSAYRGSCSGVLQRRARVGVKIQDGCNNRCTYCIVWKARGPERSVPVEAVLEEVRAALDEGLPEVVLTGVNLGAYDGEGPRDAHVEIDELVDTILRETAVPHIRLSSIEPMDVSDRLIACVAASGGRVAPFFHLPVQSGCTRTLERMGRPYTAAEFEGLCHRIRAALPSASLSCDLIVGFPGETDEEFEESLALCERVGFSRMHVFRYSARPGTPAASMPHQVPPEVMAARSHRARELAARLAQQDAEARIGTVERAVIEEGCRGTLASFHRVEVSGLEEAGIAAPAIVDVAIMDVGASGLVRAQVMHAGNCGKACEAAATCDSRCLEG